ncbi:MAG: hypothetical protein KF873_02065 [Gemmataceae bacterium]|nr:hypothetical protein [Gemmataceae bacterium]
MEKVDQLRKWIADRYGPIDEADVKPGVFVATVGVYSGGVAMGLGSSPAAAIDDLRLDLSFSGLADVAEATTGWERARREKRVLERRAK